MVTGIVGVWEGGFQSCQRHGQQTAHFEVVGYKDVIDHLLTVIFVAAESGVFAIFVVSIRTSKFGKAGQTENLFNTI